MGIPKLVTGLLDFADSDDGLRSGSLWSADERGGICASNFVVQVHNAQCVLPCLRRLPFSEYEHREVVNTHAGTD